MRCSSTRKIAGAGGWRGTGATNFCRLSPILGPTPGSSRSYTQLDASFGVNLTDKISLVFEGLNLTDNNVEEYNIVGPVSDWNQFHGVSNSGRRFQVGMRMSL